MDKRIFQHLPEEERVEAIMKDGAVLEPVLYVKIFSEEEIIAFKDELSEKAIEIDQIEEELKEFKLVVKSKMDPLKQAHSTLLSHIRTKQTLIKEDAFRFMDWDKKEVLYYNSRGELVSNRPMRPEERQVKIFEMARTGTDG